MKQRHSFWHTTIIILVCLMLLQWINNSSVISTFLYVGLELCHWLLKEDAALGEQTQPQNLQSKCSSRPTLAIIYKAVGDDTLCLWLCTAFPSASRQDGIFTLQHKNNGQCNQDRPKLCLWTATVNTRCLRLNEWQCLWHPLCLWLSLTLTWVCFER